MTTYDELPPGWCWSTVGEVGEVRLGRQRSPSNRSNLHPTKYLRAANITWEGLDLSEVLDMDFTPAEQEVYRLRVGDVLLSEASGSAAEVGKPTIWRGEIDNCCFQNTVIRFRPRCVEPAYAHIAFSHLARNGVFAKVSKGVGIQHLSADRFAQLRFPLPPAGEQLRVVAKVEELLSDLSAGVTAMERARANLKKYRAAVLKAAVTGDLTADWRAAHPHVEPATKLLDRILAERRWKWETDQQAKFAANGKPPPKNWQEKYPEPLPPEAAELPELPQGWCWATLDMLAALTGGITKGQKRKPGDRIREVPYLRVANVQRGHLDLTEIKTIEATEEEVAELRLQDGDVLFNEGGDRDKLGRGWVWRGEVEECIHQNHVFRARLFRNAMHPEFISHHGNTFGKEWFSQAGKQSVNLASINLSVLRRFPVPVPPADEQWVIITAVQEILSGIDATENYISSSLKRGCRLRQSILKEAFAGRLVPQNPNDEPASVLLSRIRGSRTTSATPSRPRPGRRLLRRREPKGIIFRRGSVASYIVNRLSANPSFGRTQLVKTLHLTQAHVGIDLAFEFKRHPMGPLDEVVYKVEGFARKQGWFVPEKRKTIGVTYRPGPNIEERCREAADILGDKRPEMDRLLTDLAPMNTDQAELFSTVFAAWNDLLLDGRPAEKADIVTEVYAWHESKKRFAQGDILARVAWMRDNGYVPTGSGPRTQDPPGTDDGTGP